MRPVRRLMTRLETMTCEPPTAVMDNPVGEEDVMVSHITKDIVGQDPWFLRAASVSFSLSPPFPSDMCHRGNPPTGRVS